MASGRGAASPAPTEPFDRNLAVFDEDERRQHAELLRMLFSSVLILRERPDGYDFLLPDGAEWIEHAARFIILERRCCPFLSLSLHAQPPHEGTWIALTGPHGVKPFLGEEVGPVLPESCRALLQPSDTELRPPADDGRELRFRRAIAADLGAVQQLLNSCGLPAGDLRSVFPHVLLACMDDRIVGCVGLEVHDGVGLLRSLAVAPNARSRGLGHTLFARMLEYARQRQLKALYVLTTDAQSYFEQRGFVPVPRERVPEGIRLTSQFRLLCPASAVCMKRDPIS